MKSPGALRRGFSFDIMLIIKAPHHRAPASRWRWQLL